MFSDKINPKDNKTGESRASNNNEREEHQNEIELKILSSNVDGSFNTNSTILTEQHLEYPVTNTNISRSNIPSSQDVNIRNGSLGKKHCQEENIRVNHPLSEPKLDQKDKLQGDSQKHR